MVKLRSSRDGPILHRTQFLDFILGEALWNEFAII